MERSVSLFALAAWAAYHGVSAMLAGPAGGPIGLAAAAAHAGLAGGATLAALRLYGDRDIHRAERLALAVLGGGLALAAAKGVAGEGGDAPGIFAAATALTVLALLFDRRIGVRAAEAEEEAEYRAFLRLAVELGAEGGARPPADRGRRAGR